MAEQAARIVAVPAQAGINLEWSEGGDVRMVQDDPIEGEQVILLHPSGVERLAHALYAFVVPQR